MDFWNRLPTTADEGGARILQNLVERSVFDGGAFASVQRASAYQAQCAGKTAKVTPLTDDVHVHAVSYVAAPLRLHAFDNSPFLFERSRETFESDGIDAIALQHIVRGHAVGWFDGVRRDLPEGCVYVIDFSQSCRIEEQADVRLLLVMLPRAVAKSCFGTIVHGHVVAPERTGAYSDALHALALKLETWPRAQASTVFAELRQPLVDMIGGAPAATESRLLVRVRAFVDANLGERMLTPQHIADALGVSRSALYEALKGMNGIERFIYERRLVRVHARLLDPDDTMSVASLAEEYGFGTPDHLTKLFRQRYGLTPSRLRAGETSQKPTTLEIFK